MFLPKFVDFVSFILNIVHYGISMINWYIAIYPSFLQNQNFWTGQQKTLCLTKMLNR